MSSCHVPAPLSLRLSLSLSLCARSLFLFFRWPLGGWETQVPDMAEHELVLQLDVYGLEWDPRTESSGYARDKFMKFLKDHFGMHKNALPYY